MQSMNQGHNKGTQDTTAAGKWTRKKQLTETH